MKKIPPIRTRLVDAAGFITRAWALYFQAGQETYIAGLMADIPTNLQPQHAGLIYFAADFERNYLWTWDKATATGAWVRAPGEAPHHYIWCDEAPGDGYALADGSTIQRTTADGQLEDYTPINMVGRFLKGGTTAATFAAVAPGVAGSTDAAPDHSHDITHDHPSSSTDLNGSGASITTAAGPYAVAALSHAHTFDTPAHVGNSGDGGAHSHSITITADDTGEPAHGVLLPYYRL